MMRYSLFFIFWFVGFLVCGPSIAQTVGDLANPTQSELRGLLTARSLSELEFKEAESVRRRSLNESCQSELRLRLLPRSCFRQLTKSNVNTDETHRLTRICVENAKKSTSRLDLEVSVDQLPLDCQRASRDRLEDLRYADDGVHPELSVSRTSGPEFEMALSH